jgi:hypothetical protein
VFYDAHTPDWEDVHQRGNAPFPGFPLLADAQPQRDLAVMSAAGVDSVVIFAKCQYGNAYYPTEVGHQHSALNGRDLFGEQLLAAHERDIRVIAYFSNMWDTAAAGRNPEWVLVPHPTRRDVGRWPALCLLSGYRSYAHDQVREIAERYEIDGLWSDILSAGPCACERCQSAFLDRYGHAMPMDRASERWAELVEFSQDTIFDYLAEQRGILHRVRPDAALIPNFYGTTYVDPVTGLATRHLELADVGSSEGYTDWHGLGFPSFAANYIRAGVLSRPHEVLVSRFVHTWDFTMRSAAQMRFEAFTVASHGATVSFDDQPYATGAIEPEVYRRLAPIYRRIAERAPWTEGFDHEPYVALYASESARRLESRFGAPENESSGEQSAQFPQSEPRSSMSDLVAAVTGTYRALVEAHLPVQFMDEREASLGRLPSFAALVLPDALALSEIEASSIRKFVMDGGGLVVTGPVGVRDSKGRLLAVSPLADLLGLQEGPPGRFPFPYIHLTEPELAHELGTWPLPHYGRIGSLSHFAADIAILAKRTDPVLETDDVTYWHNNQPAPGPETDDPVIVERAYGLGRVVVSAARLGNNHARLGHGSYRDLLASLVRRVAGREPSVHLLGAHRNTELVVTQRDDHLVAHLVTGYPVAGLDLHGARQPAAIEDVANVSSLSLRVAGLSQAFRVVRGQLVDLPVRGDTVELLAADDWETVVLHRRSD